MCVCLCNDAVLCIEVTNDNSLLCNGVILFRRQYLMFVMTNFYDICANEQVCENQHWLKSPKLAILSESVGKYGRVSWNVMTTITHDDGG